MNGMKESEARKENLMRLIELRFDGSQVRFADSAGMTPSYISQMLTGYRNIGERTARKIERAIGLPEKYLDQPAKVFEKGFDELRKSSLRTSPQASAHFANKDRVTAEMLAPLLDLRFAKQAMRANKASLSLLRPSSESGMKKADFNKVNGVINRHVDRILREGIDLLQGESVDEVAAKTLAYWREIAA